MAFDRAIDNVVLQVGNAGDRSSNFDAIIQRGQPPAIRAAARTASNTESLRVNFGPRFQVIKRSDAVPRFNAGGRVTERVPPPHPFAIGAVMEALDFAELECVDDQADIALSREPRSVVLIGNLVSVTDAVLDHRSVTAEV